MWSAGVSNIAAPQKFLLFTCICAHDIVAQYYNCLFVGKNLGVGLLVATIWLELCTSYSSSCRTTTAIDLSSNKIQNGDTLVPAYPGCPGNWPLNECYLTVPVIYRTETRILSNDKLKGSRVPELEHWSIGPPELCDGSIDATRSFIERKRQNVSMSVDVQVCSAGSVAACRQN